MSWKERIERHLAEQRRQEEEAARAVSLEKQRQEKIERLKGEEKLPPLVNALEQLHCKTLLTQIRDEVWKFGRISEEPDMEHLTPDTPLRASVILSAGWPRFEVGWEQVHRDEALTPYHIINEHKEILSINASYGETEDVRDIIFVIGSERLGNLDLTYKGSESTKLTSLKEASQFLEKILLKDCIERGRFLYAQRDKDIKNSIQRIEEYEEENRKQWYDGLQYGWGLWLRDLFRPEPESWLSKFSREEASLRKKYEK